MGQEPSEVNAKLRKIGIVFKDLGQAYINLSRWPEDYRQFEKIKDLEAELKKLTNATTETETTGN